MLEETIQGPNIRGGFQAQNKGVAMIVSALSVKTAGELSHDPDLPGRRQLKHYI